MSNTPKQPTEKESDGGDPRLMKRSGVFTFMCSLARKQVAVQRVQYVCVILERTILLIYICSLLGDKSLDHDHMLENIPRIQSLLWAC